jgi:multidrug efflux pump subunit AcrB
VQRGRDEVKVLVRLPEAERRSPYNIEELMVRTPAGAEIPLREAAEVVRGTSYTTIIRTDGRRVLSVTADVEAGVANASKVVASVRKEVCPRLLEAYPGLRFELDGEQEDHSLPLPGPGGHQAPAWFQVQEHRPGAGTDDPVKRCTCFCEPFADPPPCC